MKHKLFNIMNRDISLNIYLCGIYLTIPPLKPPLTAVVHFSFYSARFSCCVNSDLTALLREICIRNLIPHTEVVQSNKKWQIRCVSAVYTATHNAPVSNMMKKNWIWANWISCCMNVAFRSINTEAMQSLFHPTSFYFLWRTVSVLCRGLWV